MKNIYVYLNTGISGSRQEDIIEVEDNATEKEIEEIVKDWIYNFIQFGWSEKPFEK